MSQAVRPAAAGSPAGTAALPRLPNALAKHSSANVPGRSNASGESHLSANAIVGGFDPSSICETYELSNPSRVASWDFDQFRFSRCAVTCRANTDGCGGLTSVTVPLLTLVIV